MMTIVDINGAMLKSQPLRNMGILESITSRSLDNLLRILPSGVVSKNDIGACNILSKRLLCKFLDAATVPIADAKSTIQIVMAATGKQLSVIKYKNTFQL